MPLGSVSGLYLGCEVFQDACNRGALGGSMFKLISGPGVELVGLRTCFKIKV